MDVSLDLAANAVWRKDRQAMRKALEALEACRPVVLKYADCIETAEEDFVNGDIYRAAGAAIEALEERLLE